jgi:two-component system response regulator AtoC
MRILVVDDEKRMVESLVDYLRLEGLEALSAADGRGARRLLEEEAFDAVVTDLRMPNFDGLELLGWIREEGPSVPVIMISAHGEVKDAVAAMKLGAYDYLMKPFDPDELILRLKKATSERLSARRLEAGARRFVEGGRLIGESPAMLDVGKLIARAAPSMATILLTGESGTGKEVAASLIHEKSGRPGPFVAVNVGAVPESLLESELFGHEKGAFTGADSRRIGLFEAAQGGTLFLDEIGDLPIHLQVKLLRVIQEKKVMRLGATKGFPIDVRLLAATNRDLETEMREGRFREDLYYRLNVIRIRLPALREREGDVGLLAGYFLRKLSKELGRRMEGMSPEALAHLESYRFPGNVRELENAMERAVILADGPILERRDLHLGEERPDAGKKTGGDYFSEPRSLAETEKNAIEAALRRNGWHREKSAAELGITRRTLLNKVKDYGIEVPGRAEED